MRTWTDSVIRGAKAGLWTAAMWASVAASQTVETSPGSLSAEEAHAGITAYIGPETCLECHTAEAEDVFHSVHYQWTGPTPNVPNIPGDAGKGHRGFNSYCGSVETSRRIGCSTCHVGMGLTPQSEPTPRQLQNIDCLMCHSELYQRRAVSPIPEQDINRDLAVNLQDLAVAAGYWNRSDCEPSNGWCRGADTDFDGDVDFGDLLGVASSWLDQVRPESLTFVDYQGVEHTWQLPAETAEGDFGFVPDVDRMVITPLQAARMPHRPTRTTCLRCHAYAAGSDCGKRGDLSSATASLPLEFDIHMSPDEEDFACQRCHEFEQHRVLGRGLDLRPNDRPEALRCTRCHEDQPHHEAKLDNHTARVACQSCHIPRYAKSRSTEMDRDWNNPQWFQGLFGGQGGYKPEEIREQNVIPTYAWYDGTSNVYVSGQVPVSNEVGELVLSSPHGAVDSEGARIHPMKEHLSESAIHDETGVVIPHSTFLYFVTGDFSRAVEEGMRQEGLSGSWTLARVRAFQTINHGVEPEQNALDCGSCHASLADGQVLRMNLQGEMGYALKGPRSEVCRQCHGPEEAKPFKTIHDIHVKNEEYDCSWCHTFSRPGRGLTLPPS